MSAGSTISSLKAAIERYPGVSVITMPRGQVMVTDQNLDSATIYGGTDGANTADALGEALRDLIEEYGIK